MAFVDFSAREIHCKIVYYGPGLGGKTKNLQYLHERTAPSRRGQLISLATPNERTLFFDFLPLDVGSLRGFQTRLHLYTVPGQVFYDAARRAILRGVDGIVFVADSQEARLAADQGQDPAQAAGPAGKVVFIAVQAQPDTGNFAAKVRFPNPGLRLRANTGYVGSDKSRIPVRASSCSMSIVSSSTDRNRLSISVAI